jgi:uncharacterized protein YxeA
MAKRSLKVTGFTRFMLVMIIVAPLAYIGASYYNGEDGIQNIKNFLNIEDRQESVESTNDTTGEIRPVNQSPSAKALEEENKKLKEELEFKSKRVDELYLEIEELKRKLESAEKVIGEAKK